MRWWHNTDFRHPADTEAGRFERWLIRAPRTNQQMLDTWQQPVKVVWSVLSDYEETLRTPWVVDLADLAERLAGSAKPVPYGQPFIRLNKRLDDYKTSSGLALPYKDIVYTSASDDGGHIQGGGRVRSWAGTVWRRDKATVVVVWKPGSLKEKYD